MSAVAQPILAEQEYVQEETEIHPVQSGTRRLINTSPLLAAAVSAPLFAAADLKVIVQQVEHAQGQIMVAIYDKAASFAKVQRAGFSRSAETGQMEFTFPRLPVGDYAVMAYHDLNGNGKLDTDSLGIPREPWGGSFADKPQYRAPVWSDAKFTLTADGRAVTISLA